MGVYSAWLESQHPELLDRSASYRWLAAIQGRYRASQIDPDRVVVISDFEPPASLLRHWMGGLPRHFLLPFSPTHPLPEVSYSLLQQDVNPMAWEPAIPAACDVMAVLLPRERVMGRTLVKWSRCGIRRCLFLRDSPVTATRPRVAAAIKAVHNRTFAMLPTRSQRCSVAECRDFLKAASQRPDQILDRPHRITHVIDTLGGGGAERQLCNVALAQKAAGLQVRVIVTIRHGNHRFYSGTLQNAGIPVIVMGAQFNPAFHAAWCKRPFSVRPFQRLSRPLREMVLDLAAELLLDRPDLLHCWIDDSNIAGMVAAQVIGIPRVIASLRSVRTFNEPCWMRPWYQATAELPNVKIVANSQAGADAYEEWLARPKGSIGVTRNLFVAPRAPSADIIARFRDDHGLAKSDAVIAGIFRLEVEKRPLWFLKVISALREHYPKLRALIAGTGTYEPRVEREIRRLGLQTTVTLLGQIQDVSVVLSASDILLLVSEREGTPNVALEAQQFGCIPVLSDVGGAKEAIEPGRSGLLFPRDDLQGFVQGIRDLLADPSRRALMAQAGNAFLADRYDPQKNLQRLADIYCEQPEVRPQCAA